MVIWLEDDGSENDNDEDLWGYKKVIYHFSDLKEWLDERKKGKGKESRRRRRGGKKRRSQERNK